MAEPAPVLTNSRIVARYRERTPKSAKLADEARRAFPGGLTHDARALDPYPLYVERADGARKWDADGNDYVDYFGGHGALLLGHNHPEVAAAVTRQLSLGTHYGSAHELEIRWAQAIQRLMPAAERIRFTSSGTEATLLALRLARAFTGRTKIARFASHFHGWHDHLAAGYVNRFDGSAPVGVLNAIAADVLVLPPNDEAALAHAFAAHPDIAAVILEPTGGSFGRVPADPGWVHAIRRLTQAHGALLVFDEVITGFRCAPGGAQAVLGIRPDLVTMAKIMAGGLPGGAVAGRADIMSYLDGGESKRLGREKILHFGTYNANPVSAAAGIAALDQVATTDVCARANAYAERLRAELNEAIAAARVPWAAYGTFSGFHIFTNPKGRTMAPDRFDPLALPYDELRTNDPALVNKLRLGMLNEGVDINGWPGGNVSGAHGAAELDATVRAFAAVLKSLKDEGDIRG
ncbi:MAG: aspartate aminotransferase family protein [Alphaproteobacteria bacterium]|nr:aspartate aminotransferase family protein [Alphaproteobacteria bacterium]